MFVKKNKHRKIVLLACSKVNSIERIIFKALEDARISHEEFILTINREKNYLRPNESIRGKNRKWDDSERNRLTKQDKRVAINEILNRYEKKSKT